MASDVQICNLSLIRLGAKPIGSLNEDNDRAIACFHQFESVRDATLEDFPWPFALKRKELAKLAIAPVYGYKSAFQIPEDSLRVVSTDDDGIPWKQEGETIVSDRDKIKVKYISRITDPNKFSRTFIDALAERIASEIAVAVTGKLTLKDAHYKIYQSKIQAARTDSSQIGTPDTLETFTLIDVREQDPVVPLAK